MTSDTVTWIGTILTAVGTLVTLWQAGKVKRYRDQVAFNFRKISISEAGEILRRAQEDCRKLLKSGSRGQSNSNVCDSIQEKIDHALNRFTQKDHDQDIKEKLNQANSILHKIRGAESIDVNSSSLHVVIQEAITSCNERISEIS